MSLTFTNTIIHLIPYGTPLGLMILLPLIESIRQILRPFTLAIRLATNLASGHILIFIVRYFTHLLGCTIIPVILGLQLFELAISILQVYIFVALLDLYFSESSNI